MANIIGASHSLKAVFFDVGRTLIHPHPSVGSIYANIAATYGMTFRAEDADINFKKAFATQNNNPLNAMDKEQEWWKHIVIEAIKPLASIKNFDAYFSHLWNYFTLAEAWEIFPNVSFILQKCKALNLKLGIISNWDSRLIPLLKTLELDHHFETISVSALIGAAKPDRKIFEHALASIGAKPQEAIHIGDSINDDGRGAENAGIVPVIIDRKGNNPSKYQTIRSLNELFTVM